MTRIAAYRHGVPIEATDEDVEEMGRQVVGSAAAADNHVVVDGTIVKVVDRPAVRIVDGDYDGWLPTDGPDGVGNQYGSPEARTVVWEADAEVSPEAVAVEGHREDDGAVMVDVPTLLQDRGGSVRVMHRLGVPVQVAAYRYDNEPVGYVLATTIDEHEEQVEVLPDTALLRITPR
jgi:hypothetical protein